MTPVAVYDTNVLFSAAGWGGTPGRCIDLIQQGRVDGIICFEILAELTRQLSRKLLFSNAQIEDVLGSYLRLMRVVEITGRTGLCPDPKDDMVVECALVSGAGYIVTGDRKHLLHMGRIESVSMISPADFLRMVEAP